MAKNNNDFNLKKSDIDSIFSGAQRVVNESQSYCWGGPVGSDPLCMPNPNQFSMPSNTINGNDNLTPIEYDNSAMTDIIDPVDPFGNDIMKLHESTLDLITACTEINISNMMPQNAYAVRDNSVKIAYHTQTRALHNISTRVSKMMLKRNIILQNHYKNNLTTTNDSGNNNDAKNMEVNDEKLSSMDSILVDLNTLRNHLHAEANAHLVGEDSNYRSLIQKRLNDVIRDIDDIINKYNNKEENHE